MRRSLPSEMFVDSFGITGEFTERDPVDHSLKTFVLTPPLDSGLDGGVELSVYSEPATVLWARLESQARKDGWIEVELPPQSGISGRLYQNGGRIKIMLVNELAGNLRTVAIYDGKIADR